jgi:hypothetical protein
MFFRATTNIWTGPGPSTAFILAVPKFATGMNHTSRVFGSGMNYYRPLDG